MRSVLLIVLLFVACTPVLAAPPTPRDLKPDHVTTIVTRDSQGKLKACRLEITDVLMEEPVLPVGSARYYTAYSGHNYVHSPGMQQVATENSIIRIQASSGFEFMLHEKSIWVGQNDTVNIVLERAFDMREEGWYSGDMHVHIKHGGDGDVYNPKPYDIHTIAQAEDLAFTSVLSNGLYFTGAVDPISDPDHLIYFGLEFRSGIYGHMAVVGMPAITATWCCTPHESPPYPSNSQSAISYKKAGATVVLAHPATTNLWEYATVDSIWPYSGFARELPALVLNGAVDALDVFSYSNVNLDLPAALWFDILDLGIKMPLSAGTDAATNRYFDPPPGGYRVYVNLDEPFTMDHWLEGLRQGRSFATNGPLPVHFSLNDVEPGGLVEVPRNGVSRGSFKVYSLDPMDRIELIGNGSRVIASFSAPNTMDPNQTTWEQTFDVVIPDGTTWVVLKAIVSRPGFHVIGNTSQAYTSPIYIKGLGRNQRAESLAATQYVKWIDDLEEIALELNQGFDPDGLNPLFTNFDYIKDKLLSIKRWEDTGLDVKVLGPAKAALEIVSPGEAVVFSAQGHGLGRVEVFDLQGRLVARLPQQELPTRWSWSPGPQISAGVYFARIVSPGEITTRRVVVLP